MPASLVANTFAVSDVSVPTKPLHTEKAKASVERLLGGRVKSCDSYTANVVKQPGFHALIAAAHLAFEHHYPLVLTPDAVWLTIAQGLAHHVNNNAEELRPRLVPHAGKLTIHVRRDDFVMGSPENPWPEVFPCFSAAIQEVIGADSHGLIVSSFSTTRPVEKAASEVVLMGAVQPYFEYHCHTLCGIPQVSLEGTAEDWEQIHERAGRLTEFGLGWWTSDLLLITSELVKAAKGQPTRSFWQALYKQVDESGGPYTRGWLVRLVPYLRWQQWKYKVAGDPRTGYATPWQTTLRNPLLGHPFVDRRPFSGVTSDHLPSSASQVPFVWDYLGKDHDYQFVAGVLSVSQDPDTRAIRPRVGWAVRSAPKAS
jgi:hypothetical protein